MIPPETALIKQEHECMHRKLRTFGEISVRLVVGGLFIISSTLAGDVMPVARQNALVHTYCAVCHTDAARNGRLTLQHFDAADVAPSLAAMLVSKLNGGAMGAAGIKRPDQATVTALITALLSRAVDASKWAINRTQDPSTSASIVTASILRELPSARKEGVSAMYRLVL